jgi:UDP-galactopyranose mutase
MLEQKTGLHAVSPGVKAAFTQDVVCLSHLRWKFVYQRPQHILSRCATDRRVFFVEEPVYTDIAEAYLHIAQDVESGVWVATPQCPHGLTPDAVNDLQRQMLNTLMETHGIKHPVVWYYTPMALAFSQPIKAAATVYDCMDELSAFAGAPPELKQLEQTLLQQADVVFTGGHTLYKSKATQHPNVHACPSSVDVPHFAQAKKMPVEPDDQLNIPHPRLGFFGVIDERLDIDLVNAIAEQQPDWQLVFIGPVVKIDPDSLPKRPNIHYLGAKTYQELPVYLAHWDVALLPFALNESTRFISPTKTPEYLAAGKPVVSTAIQDVVEPYETLDLVRIGRDKTRFIEACHAALTENTIETGRQARIDEFLATLSWDNTWTTMCEHIFQCLRSKSSSGKSTSKVDSKNSTDATKTQPDTKLHYIMSSKREFDYLIVGAGFAGCVLAERLASDSGKRVLIVDKRAHIGGNAYDTYNDDGILVHPYGPHIFHTNSADVFQYLSQFTRWRFYEHRVLASVDGKLLPMPINLDTINLLYDLNLTSDEMTEFLALRAEHRDTIRTSEDVVVSKIGRELYEKFFKGYTHKQWGVDPSALDASVTSRVPTRTNQDDRYFTDKFQFMPLPSYTNMFNAMLNHANIKIMLNTDYREIAPTIPYHKMIYTGPVDAYFDYRYGKLPYRSLEFEHKTLDAAQYQSAAVINYPNDHDYTRITEFKYLTGQQHHKTSIVAEYPQAEGDPYYPVPCPDNTERYNKYKALADATPNVSFVGRLATYRYYNMDQVVAQALTTYQQLKTEEKPLKKVVST